MWTLFIIAERGSVAITEADIAATRAALQALAGLAHARIMVPDKTPGDQPFAKDGPGPNLALELYFATEAAATAAMTAASPLATLAPLVRAGKGVTHQLMKARDFPTGSRAPTDPCLTFLVSYRGPAADLQHWLDHYDANHPPIMVRFPGIREVETCRPVEWASALPFARATAMQRNKVVFDSFADLLAALASPVMLEMRADSATFPKWEGGNTHFPMTTWRVG